MDTPFQREGTAGHVTDGRTENESRSGAQSCAVPPAMHLKPGPGTLSQRLSHSGCPKTVPNLLHSRVAPVIEPFRCFQFLA